jgi:Right handed beta helix region/CotH kinase protein
MIRFTQNLAKGLWARWGWSVRLRDVIMFSLLPLLVGLYVVAAAILDYSSVRQFDDSWSRYVKLDSFFVERISGLLKLPKMWALQRRLTAEKDDSGIIRLVMPRGLWNSWEGDSLAFFDQWANSTLVRGNNLSPVKLRKRGDNSVHWMTEKKSFTLRTRHSTLFKGYSRLAFSAKTVLQSFTVARLANEFDLLAPFTTVAPVFVNERFYGIFRVLEVIDESFLRRHNRLPGNIFRGDAAERGEVYKGLPRGLTENPYIWDRVAKDHLPSAHADSTLQAFLLASNGTTFNDHLRLMSWVDQDEISRLLALMLVVGDPLHISDVNNNFWYLDPSSGLLHPIPWDLRLLVLKVVQTRHYRVSRLLAELLRSPFVLDRALHVLYEKISGDHLMQTAQREMWGVYERYREHFQYDRLREPFVPYPGTPEDVLYGLRQNISLLNDWFNDSVVAFHAEPQGANGMILDFEARGYTGSDLHAIGIEGDMKMAESVRLVADVNRNGILDPSDQEIDGKWTATPSGGQLMLANPQALLPGIDTDKPGIKPAPLQYRFFLTFRSSNGSRPQVSGIRADLRNRLTGKVPQIIEWRAGEPVSATPSWHPWQYPSLQPSVVHRIRGDTRLHETLIITKGDMLVIDPGTTVRLDPDVSILSLGRVVARGTSDRPITFRPSVTGKPWGTFALQGEGANGSDFEHVRFRGGGGATLGRIEYTGMVDVHRAQQVTFNNCDFSENVRSDDALHAAHSNLLIQNSTFLRTNSDSIDFDYSSGMIANNRFEASGNDSIDLMGSAPQIIGNHITGAGDKGISVGEDSRPFVFNNYIVRSQTGIGIKDQSEPFLLHNMITQNKIGINQYAKNWRYGNGGWGKLADTTVVNNGTDIESDKHSRLTIVGIEKNATGPMPVSMRTARTASTDSAWIFAQYGIRPASDSAGQINGWKEIKPVVPKVLGTFEDDFEETTDGWRGFGGVSRLEKRDYDLQATFFRSQGYISRNVDWDLTDRAYTYVAVLELAGRNIRSAAVSVLGAADGEMTRSFALTGGLSSYAFVTVELKPGRYKTIKIAADPGVNTGRVHLHGYRLYAIPKGDLAVMRGQ